MADEVEMIPVTAAEPPKVKPTLKLPPKPALKLPPKPAALKPGLKLPTQAALKPGLKLPAKPVIRKPGATVAAAPLPKPIAPAEAPKPVAQPKPMEQLKTVTQKLKSITQEVPQQAILHKTGIIAEGAASDAQKEAAKHKTARISLSDAMGVAPVQHEATPMKTIRIKRPVNIPTATSPLAPQPAAPAPAAPQAPAAEPAAAEPAPTVTQRKTLKISRPASKFAPKRPAAAAAKPAEEGAAPADAGAEVADIPDIQPAVNPVPQPTVAAVEGPGWLWTLSVIVQLAACVAIGALAWFLYENSQLPTFCGGLGWGS